MIANSVARRRDPEVPAPSEPVVPSAGKSTFPYAVNGRFLSQSLTGVQRYGSQVVRALDDLLADRNGFADILAPRLNETPHYKAMQVSTLGSMSGHLWEQAELPFRSRRPLLSLCNMGPIAAVDQILCIHDVNVYQCPESYSRSFRLAYRTLLPRLARRARRLATVSHASAMEIASRFSVRIDDIAVLPNGHEHVLTWRPERSSLRQREFRPFVLTIGSAARHKNNGIVFALAEALDARGLDIVVAGGGASIFADTSQAAAPNMHVLGRVSDEDLASLYGRALCLAFPSRAEGFGLPPLEAMTLGCPVVASPIPSSLEVCGEAALFADPDDGEAWLRHIETLAGSADLRADLAGRGRVRARGYSWRQTAQGYYDLATSG